jgi:hypothetical protein
VGCGLVAAGSSILCSGDESAGDGTVAGEGDVAGAAVVAGALVVAGAFVPVCILWSTGCASLAGATGDESAGEGDGAAGMSMPVISCSCTELFGCGAIACGAREVEAFSREVETLFRGVALFFGAFGFGLLAPGMLLMSCPSCCAARATWPGDSSALRKKQAAIRTGV